MIRQVSASGVRVDEIPHDTRITLVARRGRCVNGHPLAGCFAPRSFVGGRGPRVVSWLSQGQPFTRLCADWERPAAAPCQACLVASVALRARSSRKGIIATLPARPSATLPLELLRWVLPTPDDGCAVPTFVALNAGGGAATDRVASKSAIDRATQAEKE